MERVNDIHSRLNETAVERVLRPRTIGEVQRVVAAAARERRPVSVCGGRHAMGGQQFGTGSTLIDMTELSRPIGLDLERGLLTIESGADWRQVIQATHDLQGGQPRWAIRQKQTGADSLTIGGSIACNAHGRGLLFAPLVGDIESMEVVSPTGELVPVSREVNGELFPLIVGGFGLFGIVARATLRLMPRRKVRRLVDIIDLDEAMHAIRRRIDQGCLYGDFQYAIDESDDSFLRRGVMACYEPVADDATIDSGDVGLPRDAWLKLLALAHQDQCEAFKQYSLHYLASHGQVYWSDTMQLSTYIPTYSEFIAKSLPEQARGPDRSLMITELFVPPEELNGFMAAARGILRESDVQDIYGTIRAIRKDTETFLPWARDDFACIIFNLLTEHTEAGVDRTRRACRALIDAAAARGGSFYLTYHRWASREQLLRCHPRLPEFLDVKERLDPNLVFDSDWHRWLRSTLGT
jgi:FAD/FMN-containing dehydrogenase